MMKWPQGRPGLNGENLPSGVKPNNIRRRDVSQDEYGVGGGTEYQFERRQQIKVDGRAKGGPNIPRPGLNRPLRSRQLGSASGTGQIVSGRLSLAKKVESS